MERLASCQTVSMAEGGRLVTSLQSVIAQQQAVVSRQEAALIALQIQVGGARENAAAAQAAEALATSERDATRKQCAALAELLEQTDEKWTQHNLKQAATRAQLEDGNLASTTTHSGCCWRYIRWKIASWQPNCRRRIMCLLTPVVLARQLRTNMCRQWYQLLLWTRCSRMPRSCPRMPRSRRNLNPYF